MDYKNNHNLRQNSNANVLKIFAFAFHIVTDKVGQRLNEVGNLLSLRAEFRSQCGGQI